MATPPDQLPLLVAALADHDVSLGSRIQPDGSDMRATQPGYRRFLGKVFHLLASIWVVGPVKDTQCGFKGFTRAAAHDLFARQQITSIVFDVELIYLARRRGYRIGDRADPLVRPARVADAGPTGPGRAGRLGPLPDPAHPSRQRPERRATDVMDASALSRLGRTALPIVARPRLRDRRRSDDPGGDRGRHARLRLPRLSPGGRPPAERPAALRHELRDDRRVRPVLLPADLRPAHPAARPAVGDDRGLRLDGEPHRRRSRSGSPSCPSRGPSAGGSSCWPGCRGRSPTRSSSARSARSCSCSSPSAGAGWTTRSALGASAALGTAIKLQPAIIFVWAALTRRWLAVVVGVVVLAVLSVVATIIAGVGAWSDFVTLVRQVGDPITTPHNFTPGAIAYQLGVSAEVGVAHPARLDGHRPRRGRRLDPLGDRRGVVPRRGHRQPAAVAGPVGPLRDAPAPAGGLPVRGGSLVGAAHPARDGDPAGRDHAADRLSAACFFVALGATLGVGVRAREAAAS